DVRRFADQRRAAPPPEPPAAQPAASEDEPVEALPLQGLRRRIAERMDEAWRVPHVTSFEEVDASNLAALRRSLKPEAERRGVTLSYLPLIIKAVLQTLQEFPHFNASLDMPNRKIILRRYYHIGVATATDDGLLVPVLRHADRLNVLEIAAELNRLSGLARQRKLTLPELTGSTFTVTNVGSFGGWLGTPIINPPEAAILGCGRIEDRPVAVDGRLAIRPVLPLMLSYDHRLIDGAASGRFLAHLKTLLANPGLLLVEWR
ncbi:MAG: dihydrolipoamide acetyltransferase family protein, partial [Anaerolineae bacterium]